MPAVSINSRSKNQLLLGLYNVSVILAPPALLPWNQSFEVTPDGWSNPTGVWGIDLKKVLALINPLDQFPGIHLPWCSHTRSPLIQESEVTITVSAKIPSLQKLCTKVTCRPLNLGVFSTDTVYAGCKCCTTMRWITLCLEREPWKPW